MMTKSWDIAIDLKKIAQLLLEENHYERVEALKDKTIYDFLALGESLRSAIKTQTEMIKTDAEGVLALLKKNELEVSDFARGTLPNHFKKMTLEDFNGLYNNKLEENLATGKLYAKTLSEEKASRIDALLSELTMAYHRLKKAVFHLKFLQNFYKNIVPLSLLNAIKNELESLKAEQNVVLISEFNSIISKAIANQPAPFIYERLGEKYRHYFIDEFQDTSQMQWRNLKPLISNALESETLRGEQGTLCIVGDAKQAIYRWRGGDPEQFIRLYGDHNPFQVEKEVISLPRNYRSFDTIVEFNNEFFQHIASFLTNSDHRDLYENKSSQEVNAKKGGKISLNFIPKEADDDTYCQLVLKYIQEIIEQGFAYHDICILTRTRKEGVTVAKYLLEHTVPIVSSETLLLKNNAKIDFLINLMHYVLRPDDALHRMAVLHFLAAQENGTEKHDFFTRFLDDPEFLLNTYSFETSTYLQLPLFDAVEYAIEAFNLAAPSDAYLQYFLDEVMGFVLKKGSSLSDFLTYWEEKKDTLSIATPQVPDAVQIMTIHKAKGLEFPVVIYPFATTKLYNEGFSKIWLPVPPADYAISHALLDKNKEIREFNDEASELYDKLQENAALDQFNLLYVALTRAIEQLYIITKKDTNSKEKGIPYDFPGLFRNYLEAKSLWDTNQTEYVFGKAANHLSKRTQKLQTETVPFITYAASKRKFEIITEVYPPWDVSKQPLEQGKLYHYLLSKIKYASDLNNVLEEALKAGILTVQQKKEYQLKLNAIIDHNVLKHYYTTSYTIYNERDIYTRSGEVIRPDRVAIQNNNATIIDYKTGTFNDEYVAQLNRYAEAIAEMNSIVEKKLLVFINDTIEVMAV